MSDQGEREIMDQLRGRKEPTGNTFDVKIAGELREWFRELQASGLYDQAGFEKIVGRLESGPPEPQVVGVSPMPVGVVYKQPGA